MLTPRGHVKVLDFGLAKQAASPDAQETQLMTSLGVVMGTVAYMSPEQALGREVDARTDIFSLGIVLYEMATGRVPFSGANAQETMAHMLQSLPEATARFNYDVPQELDRVIRKCLEKDAGRRYQSARELMVDLRNLDRDTGSGRAPAEASSNATRRLRAIIVDDEELARQLLREYLQSAQGGIEIVAECANGFEAVKAVSEHKPDLVFLDVQMPKLDGFEVLELIDREVSGDLRHRLRSVRDESVRRARRGLSAQAVQPGPPGKSAGARPPAVRPKAAAPNRVVSRSASSSTVLASHRCQGRRACPHHPS